jgi:hypothetical protein
MSISELMSYLKRCSLEASSEADSWRAGCKFLVAKVTQQAT